MAYSFQVDELNTGRRIRFTGKDDTVSIAWQNEYRVTVTATGGDKAKDVSPYDVVTAQGLPIVNQSVFYAGGKLIPFVICRNKDAKQEDKLRHTWIVSCSYRSIDGNQSESGNNPIDPPALLTDLSPSEQPSLGEIERVLYKDKSDPVKDIRLPSGEPFGEPVMERIPTLRVKLTQYEESITYEQMLDRKLKCNSGEYRTQARYKWLIESVEATEVTVQLAGGPASAALVTYTLAYSPLDEGWKRSLALVDYKHLVAGEFVPHLEGDPLTASPTLVTAAGVKKATQDVPDYVDFEPQDTIDFDTFLQA